MQLPIRRKIFCHSFAAFLKSTSNFEVLEKKMTLIAYVIPNYSLRNTWLDKCLENPVPEHPSTVNMLKCTQALLKSKTRHFHHIFSSL